MFIPPITAKIQHDDVVNDVINFKNRAITQISLKNPQKWLFSYHNPALTYRHSPLTPQSSISSQPYANIAARWRDRRQGEYWLLTS